MLGPLAVVVLQVGQGAGHRSAVVAGAELDARSANCSTPPSAPTARRGSTPICVEAGWSVSENTVADSMRRQALFGRKPKRRRGLTRQDRSRAEVP